MTKTYLRTYTSGLALAAVLATPAAFAQETGKLDEIVVTAQKRSENLQDVSISLQVLGSQALENQGVQNFEDYVALLPSVNFSGQGPGNSQVFMRGISSGGDGNNSGSSPSVAVYLDNQPVTSIGRILDVHMYDIARVEAVSGPQGTLYGAGSQAGTLRIITNAPDASGFTAGYNANVSTTHEGSESYSLEGFINAPLGEKAALRVAAWHAKDGGYIDNVAATTTFTSTGITVDNAPFVAEDFNTEKNTGARAALKVDLNENWTATAKIMHQQQKTNGVWDHDPEDVGDLQVERFFVDRGEDQFTQGGIEIEGRVGGLDLIYAGSYLDRDVQYEIDYSAYSEYSAYIPYYVCYTNGFYDTSTCTDPRIQYENQSQYKTETHEFRIQNDASDRLRFIAGLFYQKASHDYFNVWHIPAISPGQSVNDNPQLSGYPLDAYFTTDQVREEDEKAVFGEVSFDLTDQLTATVGARLFETKSSLNGAVGTVYSGSPLIDLESEESGEVFKGNLSYDVNDDVKIYATFSEGFRPGGNNRAMTSNIPGTYLSDLVTNYEFGWKTTLANGRVRFNGAIFNMDWSNIQFTRFDPAESFLGLTANAANARSKGIETDISILASEGLTLNGAFSYIDAELTEDYIRNLSTMAVDAPAGTELPGSPKFKMAATARYEWGWKQFEAFSQVNFQHVGARYNDLFVSRRQSQAAYDIVNFSAGLDRGNWGVSVYVRNLFDERAELNRNAVDFDSRITTNRPRTIGVGFHQRF
jgi:outer membrane receptor protein involved in Fe transport